MFDKSYGIYESGYHKGEVVMYQTKLGSVEADIAHELIARWGLVAGTPDGEDSAGRQKLALATPEDLVERACKTAELTVKEFEMRGWFMDLPAPTLDPAV